MFDQSFSWKVRHENLIQQKSPRVLGIINLFFFYLVCNHFPLYFTCHILDDYVTKKFYLMRYIVQSKEVWGGGKSGFKVAARC